MKVGTRYIIDHLQNLKRSRNSSRISLLGSRKVALTVKVRKKRRKNGLEMTSAD
jgi:hypothetical protein